MIKSILTAFSAVTAALAGAIGYLYKIAQGQNTELIEVHRKEINELKGHVRDCDEDREHIRTELALMQRSHHELELKFARIDKDGDGIPD